MSKKMIIIVAAASVVSFAGTFSLAWLTKGPATSGSTGDGQAQEQQEPAGDSQVPTAVFSNSDETMKAATRKSMTAKQLKSLVYEVREKIREYEEKLKLLEAREQRLQTANETLMKDIERLGNLQVELSSTVAGLRAQQEELRKSRVEVAAAEKANIESIALAYDKMDSASASKIIASLSKSTGNSPDDAVKILYYMTDRTKAKVLEEMATTEPQLAAYFCQKLKQITEGT